MFRLIDVGSVNGAGPVVLCKQCEPRSIFYISAGTEQRKANLLDEKGSTILKTIIELPLVFLIYSNLGAIRL